ncbi:MAG TPA: hypothetical protein VJ783_28215 [Pirellulales bacterium]|nr:hypothetical protein [Pirellulales bacterium]
MLDVQRKQIVVILVQAAIFTAAACALPDEGTESGIYSHLPEELARSWRAFDLRIATTVLYDT